MDSGQLFPRLDFENFPLAEINAVRGEGGWSPDTHVDVPSFLQLKHTVLLYSCDFMMNGEWLPL